MVCGMGLIDLLFGDFLRRIVWAAIAGALVLLLKDPALGIIVGIATYTVLPWAILGWLRIDRNLKFSLTVGAPSFGVLPAFNGLLLLGLPPLPPLDSGIQICDTGDVLQHVFEIEF